MDNFIFTVLESWSLEWCTPASSMVESEKSNAQWKKEETKLRMVQLAEKRRNESTVAKAQEAWDAVKVVAEQQQEVEKERKGQKSHSPEQDPKTEEGGADPKTVST